MSAKAQDHHKRLSAFMTEFVFPAEASYEEYRRAAGPDDHTVPPVIEELKVLAKERGLWNLFLPSVSGLTNLEYAPLAELTGWSMEIAPEVTNCAAPDTGNMETLHLFATEEQSKQWLEPLLDGEIRSAFAMTEPAVASSDARNIETTMLRDGDDYVINGRKWWISGAADPRCKILIVMGRTNPEAASHQQQSMILVPVDTPGVSIERSLPVFGWQDQHGHCEISFDNVRVPVGNLLDEEGSGFAIAQARLGPGRIHHCMRAIGVAERAMALMVDRVTKRIAFGKPLAEQGVVQQQVALSRNEIDQSRLLCHKAAWTIDQHGNQSREARQLVSMIKAVAPQMACNVIDRAIQVHGAAGVSDDTVLARLYGWHRAMRLFDGPDEVHMRTIARAELGKEKSAFAAAVTRLVPPAFRGMELSRRRREHGIQPGRLFRSGELSNLDDDGRETLIRFGVTDVADLRSAPELDRHGKGQVPDGVVIHHLPFVETLASERRCAARKRIPEDADREAGRRVGQPRRQPLHDRGVQADRPLGPAQRAVHKVITMLGDDDRCWRTASRARTGPVSPSRWCSRRRASIAMPSWPTISPATPPCRSCAPTSSRRSEPGCRRPPTSPRWPRRVSPMRCSACRRRTWTRRRARSSRTSAR